MIDAEKKAIKRRVAFGIGAIVGATTSVLLYQKTLQKTKKSDNLFPTVLP